MILTESLKNKIIYFSVLVFLLTSCREDFIYVDDSEDLYSVNLVAELIAEEQVMASLIRTQKFNQPKQDPIFQDAQMVLEGSNLNKGLISMVYDSDMKQYVVADPNIKVSEGNTYSVTIHSDDVNEPVVTASTYIPRAVKTRQIPVLEVSTEEVGGGQKKHIIELSIVLNEPIDLPAYYRVVPYRTLARSITNSDGSVSVTTFKKRIALKVRDIVLNRSAISEFAQKDGVFADQSRLENNEIHLILETPEPLTANEILSQIELDVFTLSEELYLYNQNLDEQISNAQSNFSSPTDMYSNVKNGYGVFGGASVSTLLIKMP